MTIPPTTSAPANLHPKANRLWEEAINLVEKITDSDDKDERIFARADLVETMTEIMGLVRKVADATKPQPQAQLEPCPFCGGEAEVKPNDYGRESGFVVACVHSHNGDPDECPIAPMTYPFISAEAAAEAWNTRVKEVQ